MTSQNSECNMKISKVIIVINRTKPHARQTGSALKAFLDRERVRQEWVETLPPRKDLFRKLADLRHEIVFQVHENPNDLKSRIVDRLRGESTFSLSSSPRFFGRRWSGNF